MNPRLERRKHLRSMKNGSQKDISVVAPRVIVDLKVFRVRRESGDGKVV